MNSPNFFIPEDSFSDDADINNLYQEACIAKKAVREADEKLKEAKKYFESFETQLIDKIKATGGVKWEREKGFSAGYEDKFYYSFTKDNRLEIIEFVSAAGRDDLLTVNVASLGSFLRTDFCEEDETEKDMADRLPVFISNYSKPKLTLRANGKVV